MSTIRALEGTTVRPAKLKSDSVPFQTDHHVPRAASLTPPLTRALIHAS